MATFWWWTKALSQRLAMWLLLQSAVKLLSEVDGQITLTADNPNYPDVKVGDFDESMIWGVVTNVIHQL